MFSQLLSTIKGQVTGMALSRAKIVFLLCFILAAVTFIIFNQSDVVHVKPKMKSVRCTPKTELNEQATPFQTKVKGFVMVPAGLQKTRKPNGAHPSNSPKPRIMQDVNKNKSRSKKRNNSNSASKPRNKTSAPYTAKPKISKWYYSPQEKEFKWERCKRLISGEEILKKTGTLSNDTDILDKYHPDEDCTHVLRTRFLHPPVSREEKQLPIAFGFTIHRGAGLFERILRSIYMLNNVYCIHIDKKSTGVFRKAIEAIIRCLPNVFIAANSVDVTWGHISVVQAQFSCMEELLKSPSVKWKYYISLVGQDFPLYDNKQIVQALQGLNNTNSKQSFPVPKNNLDRTKFVHILKDRDVYKTRMPKVLPPHNILIYKGSTHIIAIREFVEFVLHSQIGKDFYEFLKDTEVPDETIYSSLQRHPGVPGGINGNQPTWIPRALYWISKETHGICRGKWVRQLCWISLQDLRWALGEDKKDKLFVHKIPFDFSDELIECILVARQGRKYATSAWKEDKGISKTTSILTTVAPTVKENGRPHTAKEKEIGLPTKQKSKVSGNRTDTSKDKVENVHGTPRLKVIGTAETSNVPKRQETNKKDVPKTPTPKEMQERNKQKTSNNEKMKSNKKPKFNEVRPSGPFTEKPKIVHWYYSPKEKKSKWKRCKRLISGEEKIKKTQISSNYSEILSIYRPDQDCASVLQTRFVHPPVSKEEKQLPIAFSLTVYKGSRLLDRILRAIYMPNNVYCIHIDKKSPEVFRKAIQAIIRCLPNVFIAANSVDVLWGHITVVQAQFSCMEELLKSQVKWKYYISLVGQDFPLYDNKQVVKALQALNNTNNIESFPMPKHQSYRNKFVFILKKRRMHNTQKPKGPPPHNISIYKGSTHIIAIRQFVEFVLYSQIGKDFYEFLKDSQIPDETIYSSLQRHPGVPGGINGNQPTWIPRALYWISKETRGICRGKWVRQLCWITFQDLSWALGEEKKDKLFVHKVPFKFNEELIECILVARQGRKYDTAAWKEEKRIYNTTSVYHSTKVAPTVKANGTLNIAKEKKTGLLNKQKSKNGR